MALPANPSSADTRVSISHVVTDPIWSLRCWGLEVGIGMYRATIPPLPAADWLAVLMQDHVDLFDIVPGMCPGFEEILMPVLLEEQVSLADVRRAALDVVSAVTGRPWWFATRLIKTAAVSWELVGGELALRSVDAERISLSAWLDAVLLICLKQMESTKVTLFMSQLEAPPVEEMENVEDMEMSPDAFLALGR